MSGPGRIYGVQCDVRKHEDVSNAFQWIKENIGPVQILINNAGIFKIGKFLGKGYNFYFITFPYYQYSTYGKVNFNYICNHPEHN